MAHAEIFVTSGSDNGIHEVTLFEGPQAIKDGYKFFKAIIDDRRDWLLHASAIRDFDDHMQATVTMRIGPKAFWSDEYLKAHS